MKSYADDYVTDFDVTWPVFSFHSVNNRIVVRLPLAASRAPLAMHSG